MAIVNVSIQGRLHEIACADSQVMRVQELAAEVDRRAGDIVHQVGPVADARLLVMVALMLADEVAEARAESARMSDAAAGDAALAEGIERLAERLEGIAERLERA
ncbi:MAG: cell division protein ZapA [Magnetospirillum sp.]|nr:cell division protein ZapA [Magnetospirillum sp.]